MEIDVNKSRDAIKTLEKAIDDIEASKTAENDEVQTYIGELKSLLDTVKNNKVSNATTRDVLLTCTSVGYQCSNNTVLSNRIYSTTSQQQEACLTQNYVSNVVSDYI